MGKVGSEGWRRCHKPLPPVIAASRPPSPLTSFQLLRCIDSSHRIFTYKPTCLSRIASNLLTSVRPENHNHPERSISFAVSGDRKSSHRNIGRTTSSESFYPR